jgi:CRISPR-associated endonuclease Csn1
MSKEKVILGLDIGVGSIGWGMIKVTEGEYSDEKADGSVEKRYRITDGTIIATGVRTFQVPQDRQQKSLALQRGSARRLRKTTRRKRQRLRQLVKLAEEFGLIDDTFRRDEVLKPRKGDKESEWDIWFIRSQALDRRLSDVELFRVLYHVAKHRGFFFHTKAEEVQEEKSSSEAGRVKDGLKGIRKRFENGPWKTVGQIELTPV